MTEMSWSSKPKWLVFALLCIAALVLAGIRLSQTVVEQPAQYVAFFKLNSVQWDPANGTLTPAGEDPHAFLEIPGASIPLSKLVMEFAGAHPPGPSYVYPSPAHAPVLDISDKSAVMAEIEPMTGGFRLHFKTPPSRVVRFDLPDALRAPFILRQITYHTPFVGSSSVVFALFAGALGAAAVLLLWILVGPYVARFRAVELVTMALLVAAKLWLAGDLRLTIFPDSMHDDALFMSQGHSIANGDWLGPFGELTLSKGPVFQMFIALVQLSGIPFLDAEAGLHALACLVFVLALSPVLRSAALRLSLLAVLLFDPHTFSAEVVAQVLRSGIQPALTLLTLAGFIGLALRVQRNFWRLLPWAILAGTAFAAFWYCREEGIWLVPSIAVLSATAAWFAWRAGPSGRAVRLGVLALPFVIWFSAQWTLRAVNHHYYGAWITIDVKDGGYPNAYAALTRLTPAEKIPGVPVTKETRLRAYEVSPAFAELRRSLEGKSGDSWAQNGWEGIDHPAARKEIRGWFQWALRQAAREAGHYRTAATASAYWQRVADEINAAADEGRIAAGPRRKGFAPPLDASVLPAFAQSFSDALGIAIRFADFNPQSTPSTGDPERMAFYSRRLREPAVMERAAPTPRTHLRVVLYELYAAITPIATGIALLGLLLALGWAWCERRDLLRVGLLLSIAGGALSLIVIVALVDATSFGTTHGIYLAPATPLVLAACLLAPAWGFERWRFDFAGLQIAQNTARRFWQQPGVQRVMTRKVAVAFCFSLAVIFAGIRYGQTSTVIPGNTVKFVTQNDVHWTPRTQTLARTGADPFIQIELPERSIPVRHVSVMFEGEFADVEGRFYLFQYPAYRQGNGIDGETLTEASVTRDGGAFTVNFVLQDSKAVRIDLPDFLPRPINLREVRLQSGFVWLGSLPFRLMLISAGVGLAFLLWRPAGRLPVRAERWFEAALFALLIVGKLVVADDVPLSVYGSAAHDDALFVGQASSIMEGRWLGSFNEVTLSKGPVYSIFLAAVGQSGLQLGLVQSAFHAFACVLFVLALRPLVGSLTVRLLLFAVLLLNPHTLSAEVVGRPLRSGIHPALTLLALAGFIGLALRVSAPMRRFVGWATFAGVALSLFWYCREEGVWLVPSLSVLIAVAAWAIFRGAPERKWHRLGLLLLPVAIWYGATWMLRVVNWRYYDAPVTMDVKDGNFPRAYGAMTRITPVEPIPLVPVTKETRLRAYPFSPAFRELQPLLEGKLGDGWSQPGWDGINHPSARKEMRGWFQWAVREAAAGAGKYKSAHTANEYWGRVADELNAASDRGDLAAGPPRTGFVPKWDSSLWPELRSSWMRAFNIVVRFEGFALNLNPSEANAAQFALFERVTHEKPYDGKQETTLARQLRINTYHLFIVWTEWLTLLAIGATFVVAFRAIQLRRSLEIGILLMLFGGAFTLTTLVALVNTTAFPAINGSYLSPATPLVLATWILAPFWAWKLSSRPVSTSVDGTFRD